MPQHMALAVLRAGLAHVGAQAPKGNGGPAQAPFRNGQAAQDKKPRPMENKLSGPPQRLGGLLQGEFRRADL